MAKKDLAYFKKRFARIAYYVRETFALKKPVAKAESLLKHIEVTPELKQRVDYCCKIKTPFTVSKQATRNQDFAKTKSFVYFADLKRIVRHFPKNFYFDYIFGDVIDVPETPSFVKSRPIVENNDNAVLLKLNAIRHYQFFEDSQAFSEKRPQAVWRGMVYHQHRRDFVDMYHDKPFADVGHNDEKRADEPSYKGFMSVAEQLTFRYIVSVEGKDVATNLKWAMASNSLVMMRKPRFETWFMEGRLEPGVHYVELKDDFSDLEEKVQFYNLPENQDKALQIIANAHAYVAQFKDSDQELLVSLLVAQKYFDMQAAR
ncbi:glycosyl transferase family 90 [Rhodanobacter aciditrophus]|uniref:Glycosyl transferase family 90 n=1 Tax=Rhodanobacter aciditrophus TaxID=1623218 RepID=A0ABW4B6S2_9GAMM